MPDLQHAHWHGARRGGSAQEVSGLEGTTAGGSELMDVVRCAVDRISHHIVPASTSRRPTPASIAVGQQSVLKAALLAALGAACCIAFLRAGLPFRDHSTHSDEDSFLQATVHLLPSSPHNPLCFHLLPLPLLPFHVQRSPRSAPPHSAAHLPLLPHLSLPFPACLCAHYLDDRQTRARSRERRGGAGGLSAGAARRGAQPDARRGGWGALNLSLPGLILMLASASALPHILLTFALLPSASTLHFSPPLHILPPPLPLTLPLFPLGPPIRPPPGPPAGAGAVGAYGGPPALRAATPRCLDRTVPRGSTAEYYETRGRAMIRKAQVLKLNHFDSRLHHQLPLDLHKAGGAARAAQGAQGQGGEREQVEGGMQAKGSGKAVKYGMFLIHLRYEPDMLAFTGCEYEGGAEEKAVFDSIRQRWANLPAMDAEKQRAKGQPTATTVHPRSSPHNSPAPRAFPFTTDKHSLAHSHAMAHAHTRARDDDEDEGDEAWGGGEGGGGKGGVGAEGGGALAGVEGRKTLLAAVDYEMCRGVALLVTNNNGNMAHLLAGHRRYNGVGGTVHLFGSSIHRLLAAIQHGDHETFQKLRNRLLKGDLSTQRVSNEKAVAKGGFYAFPRDCLCEV
ncbi:unnamed protein product [Closterium sp. Naga37s-1]|nr:unnamed protein product [Closterium sp. Naga37s-1]